MEAISFGKFSHLKADTINELIDKAGEIIVKIKPKGGTPRELHVIDAERLGRLKAIEAQYAREVEAEQWRVENREAIEALNDFVDEVGIFGSETRAF